MSASAQTATPTMKYGASELKLIISRNTYRSAIGVTLAILLLILMGWLYANLLEDWLFPKPNVVRVKLIRTSLESLPPPPTNTAEPPPPPPMSAPPPAASGPAARAGTPVPIPDAMIAPDAKDFANVDQINRASSVGGDGIDNGGFGDGVGDYTGVGEISIDTRESVPDSEEFIAVEKEAVVDMSDLNKKIVYPDMARRANIEGRVFVRILVNTRGRIDSVIVQSSTNDMFVEPAVKALRNIVGTPAQQNGRAIASWITVPVDFRLR